MSKLSDALAESRDAFVAMGNAAPFSGERARAIGRFYQSNLGLAKILKGITVDEARATYEEFFGSQSEPSFDDVTGDSSSTSPPPSDETIWSDAAQTPRRRGRRRRRPRDEERETEDIYNVLGVR